MGFNLADYDAAVREFSRAQARGWLDGLPGGRGLNIAHEAVDRHAAGPRRDAVALRCIAKDDQVTELTYGDLAGQTSRFANLLGEPSEELRRGLVAFGRRKLGAVAPKEIEFDQNLPLTRSGKVMCRLLKARELGLAAGDVSTLESAR